MKPRTEPRRAGHLPEGKIAYADEIYAIPSGASDAVGSVPTNGWTFWLADTLDGLFTLAELRDQFLTRQE